MSTDINKYCVFTNNNIRKNNKYLISASLAKLNSLTTKNFGFSQNKN